MSISAQELKDLRKKLNLTQQQAAEQIGVSVRQYSKYEASPSSKTAKPIPSNLLELFYLKNGLTDSANSTSPMDMSSPKAPHPLATIIEQGEGKTLEFKECLPNNQQIVKTAIAFSNTAGGKIIIGIEDRTSKLVGISEDDVLDLPDQISQTFSDSISPSILPEIYIERLEGKSLLVIEIYPGSLKPYYLKTQGKPTGIYIRVGATNRKADMEMVQELERQRLNISFDEQCYPIAIDEALNLEKLQSDFEEHTGKMLLQEDLKNLKLIQQEHRHWYPSYGGMLLAGKSSLFEHARIKCARFKGTNFQEIIDEKVFSGPLYEQLTQGMKFIQVYLEKSGKLHGIHRKDSYAIPIEALREALVNAIIHRDYSISGSDIKVAILDHCIEITSPGALPKALEVKDILVGRSEVRNKVLTRFFKEMGYVEEWGTGIQKILQLCHEQGLPQPDFIESGLFFKIRLYKEGTL